MTESKYLRFELIEEKPKTKVYAVISKMHGSQLGIIKWFARWRQYSFWPDNATVWNKDCLRDVEEFLINLMVERKK